MSHLSNWSRHSIFTIEKGSNIHIVSFIIFWMFSSISESPQLISPPFDVLHHIYGTRQTTAILLKTSRNQVLYRWPVGQILLTNHSFWPLVSFAILHLLACCIYLSTVFGPSRFDSSPAKQKEQTQKGGGMINLLYFCTEALSLFLDCFQQSPNGLTDLV